jgi:hypothetical protein
VHLNPPSCPGAYLAVTWRFPITIEMVAEISNDFAVAVIDRSQPQTSIESAYTVAISLQAPAMVTAPLPYPVEKGFRKLLKSLASPAEFEPAFTP